MRRFGVGWARACLVVPAVAVLALAGCSKGTPTAAPPAQSASPRPSPKATGPVKGQPNVVVVTSSAGPLVFHDVPPPAPDEPAVRSFSNAIAAWLDRHLTDLQAGRGGLLQEVAAPGLLAGAPPELVTGVTRALTDPQHPVANALYHVVVVHEGKPLWARVDVTIGGFDGKITNAGFVFTPGPKPVLVAADGPPPPAPPPASKAPPAPPAPKAPAPPGKGGR